MVSLERNPERGSQDDEQEDNNVGNRKGASNTTVLWAVVGTAILTQVCSGIADRYFARGENDGREFAVAIGELRTTVAGLSAQVERLANSPYASREELRDLRSEFARFERRFTRIEGRLFPEPRDPDR